MITGNDGRPIWCEAKTYAQAQSGGWGQSNIGCQKHAQGQTPDGHYACRQHLEKAANGWNT